MNAPRPGKAVLHDGQNKTLTSHRLWRRVPPLPFHGRGVKWAALLTPLPRSGRGGAHRKAMGGEGLESERFP